ncbi:transglycosylase SLT domain-containing protein [Nitrosophilus kaiyonis]|uniref:transglycosylase SLT domain-containing protein n=1 Tax=Nitrosophilus kaiyonis TaxID=2930200 RepID=UPI00249391C4|nr:transglycosylase SLT domain-containing protein [Nitrosophilus kaiyonis]
MRFLIFLLPLLLFSKEVTLDFLSSKPASVAKDYYIWKFFDQNITKKEAWEAFYQIKNVNRKIFLKFAPKSGDSEVIKIAKCMKKIEFPKDSSCIAVWPTPYRFINKDFKTQEKILKKIKPFKIYTKYWILHQKHPFFLLLKYKHLFLDIYMSVGDKFREETLNYAIPTYILNDLKKDKRFDSFINLAATNPKLKKVHFSFFNLNPDELSHNSSFMIAMLAIKYNLLNLAKRYLKNAKEKAYYTFDIDKCNFWLYLISKNKKYLNELLKSKDLNIYTYYAYEKMGKKINIKKVKLENESFKFNDINRSKIIYISSPAVSIDTNKNQNINDPFLWLEILNSIKNMNKEELFNYSKKFKSKKLLPVYAFIIEKLSKYSIHPFITPYENLLKNLSVKKRALIYAIARQESRFIPSSISHSFALGVMQIMPFLAKAIAKDKKIKNFDLDMMFNEKKNIEFAIYHLKFLEKKLSHPLLIAYAYNGGIGFLKRKIVEKNIFDNSKFQPFLAMEMIPYSESRKYGKKVLLNYIIYLNIFEEKEKLISLIKKLKLFDHNHRF